MVMILIKFASSFIACLTIVYLFGYLLIGRIYNNKIVESVFLSLVASISLIVLVYACYMTLFRTVLLGIGIPMLGIAYYQINTLKKSSISLIVILKSLKLLAIPTILILIITIVNYVDFSSNYLCTPHPDYCFYSRVSDYMGLFKLENCQFDHLNPNMMGYVPYHYFDLWLNGLFTQIFGFTNLITFVLITYPLLQVIVFVGIYTVLNLYGFKNKFSLAVIFMFITGVYFQFYATIPFLEHMVTFPGMNILKSPKILPIYIYLLLSFYFYKNNSFEQFILSILFLPFVYITTAPSVFCSISIIILINYYFKRNPKSTMLLIALVIIATLYLFLFYYFNGDHHSGHISEMNYNVFFSFQYIKTCINIGVGSSIQLIILFFPIIIIPLLLKVKIKNTNLSCMYDNNYAYILYGLICLSSLVIWALFHNILDSVQFFTNIAMPILSFLTILLIVHFLSNLNNQKYQHIFCVYLVILFFLNKREYDIFKSQRINENHLLKVETYFKNDIKNNLGVFIRNSSDYNNIFSKSINANTLGNYTALFNPHSQLVCLSVFDILPNTPGFESFITKNIQSTTFFKFVSMQKKNNTFKNIETSQIDFIKKNKIDYAILGLNVKLSTEFKKMIYKESFDTNIGERFCVLRY